jgi:hypothetical protein
MLFPLAASSAFPVAPGVRHTMPPAPKTPAAALQELRFGCVFPVVHLARSISQARLLSHFILPNRSPSNQMNPKPMDFK